MIIDRQTLRDSLFGLVGFNNPTNPDYPNLAASLLTSRTGRKVNQVHALIDDIENIDQSIKNFSEYSYTAYSGSTDSAGGYTQGSKVSDQGKNWEYINASASSGNAPPDATYWREIDELSDYLIKAVYRGIDEMMDEWINEKKLRTKIKSIFDKILLYNGVANYRDLVTNGDNFVGLRIRFKKGERSLATIINRIGHQFSAAVNLTVYLYHSSQQDAIATFAVSHTTGRSSQWTALSSDNILRYVSNDYDAGGDFYIGYKQSELAAAGAQALKMDLHWHEPCGCDSKSDMWYKQYSPFLDVIGFEVSEDDMVGDKLFDPDDVSISYTNNYGLNLNLTTRCDLSSFIIENEYLFEEAMALSIGKVLLEGIAYNHRGGNQVANQLKVEAKKELFHSSGVWGTVFDRWSKAVKGIGFDLSGLNEACLPCDDMSEFQNPIAGMGTLY